MKPENVAVTHELIHREDDADFYLESGQRNYQVTAWVNHPGAQITKVEVTASTPAEALVEASRTGQLNRLDFDSASDTLTVHVCRRAN